MTSPLSRRRRCASPASVSNDLELWCRSSQEPMLLQCVEASWVCCCKEDEREDDEIIGWEQTEKEEAA